MTNLYRINRYKKVFASFEILSSFIDYTCDQETEKNSPQM